MKHQGRTVVTEENVQIGLKVVPGPDWEFGNQNGDSEYGIIIEKTAHHDNWYEVQWIPRNNPPNKYSENYRVGKVDEDYNNPQYDLCFYEEPILYNIENILSDLNKLENKIKQI